MQVKKKSQLQEKRVAKDLNARTVVASGALWSAKADVRSDEFLVECKTTEKPFYSLTLTTWDKIEKEAIKDGLRVPVMCVEVNDGRDVFAVFKEKDFRHYKTFADLVIGETCWSDKKSFQVYTPKRILMIKNRKSVYGETPVFVVTPWDDFLYMLKGGVN